MTLTRDELKNRVEARRQKLSPEQQKLLAERLEGKFSQSTTNQMQMELDAALKKIRQQYHASDLARVEQSLEIFRGANKPADADPRQIVNTLYFPGLSAKPWHATQDFVWIPQIEAAYETIKGELLRLLDQNATFNPYQHPYTKELGWKGWNTYSFYRANKWDIEHCNTCPETIKAIKQTPYGLRECMFTQLTPGSHIKPHSGGSNAVLTVHLGLIIPSGCEIRVEDEIRGWEAGKCLIFDDSYMHEVWHRGSETRMVLLWDIWHPDLSAIEIDVLNLIYPIIDKYLENVAKI
jgi:aspartyl/asparaginyl beta-hydroxylase (cupin superfamily)